MDSAYPLSTPSQNKSAPLIIFIIYIYHIIGGCGLPTNVPCTSYLLGSLYPTLDSQAATTVLWISTATSTSGKPANYASGRVWYAFGQTTNTGRGM